MGNDLLYDIAKPENDLCLRGVLRCGTMNYYRNLAGDEKIVDFHIFRLSDRIIICNFLE